MYGIPSYDCIPINLTTFIAVGVQSIEGEYLIAPPTWSKTIETAGTTITYIHEDNKYADRIYIPGPTQYELNLVVWWLYYSNIEFRNKTE